jgi:hypothetical protein
MEPIPKFKNSLSRKKKTILIVDDIYIYKLNDIIKKKKQKNII